MKLTVCKSMLFIICFSICTQALAQENLRAYYTKISMEEAWEKESRTTEHADIIVELGSGKMVFCRGTSYLPFWETKTGKKMIKQIFR